MEHACTVGTSWNGVNAGRQATRWVDAQDPIG